MDNWERAAARQTLKPVESLRSGSRMSVHVTDVEYLDGYRLRLRFNSGVDGIVDLQSELYGEVFGPLLDRQLFRQVFLTSRTVEWPNSADFAPEFLLSLVQTAEQVTA